jgi:metal-sulfur cluster biosynthetic enzyme
MEMPDESAVRDALRTVDDPEAGMNIVELGLVYTITVADAAIHVDMTMTTPACPVADVITEQAKAAIQAIAPAGTDVQVQLVWEPFWTPSMMSGVAKDFFGWPGTS